jgi:branched-chain amino acid transport system permease protein
MAVEANQTGSRPAGQRSIWELLRVVFTPLGQLLLFIIGSAASLGLIVIVLALLQSGARPELMQQVLVILPQVMIDGLVRGFLFATIALGYTMVYGVLEFINFAHGEIFMFGGVAGAGFGLLLANTGALEGIHPLLFVVIVIFLGMLVSGVLAIVIERIAYRPLRGSPRLVLLISTIGVSLVLQDVARLIMTNTDLGFNARFQAPVSAHRCNCSRCRSMIAWCRLFSAPRR